MSACLVVVTSCAVGTLEGRDIIEALLAGYAFAAVVEWLI